MICFSRKPAQRSKTSKVSPNKIDEATSRLATSVEICIIFTLLIGHHCHTRRARAHPTGYEDAPRAAKIERRQLQAAGNAQPLSTLHEFRFNMDASGFEQLTKTCLDVSAQSAEPEALNVTFHLYTERNPATPFVMGPLISRRELTQLTPFDWSRPTKFITHGFSTTLERSNWMLEAKDKILANERANVVLVNWGKGASPWLWFYPKAAANMHTVAQMIVNLLRRMGSQLNLNEVHLIGHSLGAHIMGFVGSSFASEYQLQLSQLSKWSQTIMVGAANSDQANSLVQGELDAHNSRRLASKDGKIESSRRRLIGRITACDPALPCFGPRSEGATSYFPSPLGRRNERVVLESEWTHLKRDSALLVEVMHTNPRVLGYDEPLGDYDFYPNGHRVMQPGCRNDNSSDESPARGGTSRQRRSIFTVADAFKATACSHHRAVDYMVESLYSDRPEQPIQSLAQLEWSHCRLVAYACSSYENFKRGFCFQCRDQQNGLQCRIFGADFSMQEKQEHLANNYLPPNHANNAYRPNLRLQPPTVVTASSRSRTFAMPTDYGDGNLFVGDPKSKRILPDLAQTYLDSREISRTKAMYYFDTRREKPFCKTQYHMLVRYRHPRPTRDKQIQLDELQLFGSEGALVESLRVKQASLKQTSNDPLQIQPLQLNRFTDLSFTSLIEPNPSRVKLEGEAQAPRADFLGQLETLTLRADDDLLQPAAIDFIEISYLSHWDPQLRAGASARFCLPSEQLDLVQMATRPRGVTTFGRCSQMRESILRV